MSANRTLLVLAFGLSCAFGSMAAAQSNDPVPPAAAGAQVQNAEPTQDAAQPEPDSGTANDTDAAANRTAGADITTAPAAEREAESAQGAAKTENTRDVPASAAPSVRAPAPARDVAEKPPALNDTPPASPAAHAPDVSLSVAGGESAASAADGDGAKANATADDAVQPAPTAADTGNAGGATDTGAGDSAGMADPAGTDKAEPAAIPSQAAGEEPAAQPDAAKSAATKTPAPLTEAATPAPVPVKPSPPPKPKLAVAVGGGAFAEAYRQLVLDPFSNESGVEITETGDANATSDIVMLDAADLARRCGKGDLVKLEIAAFSPNAASPASARDDFLDGALKPCGVASFAWSNLFVYDPAKFERRAPQSLEDVFDAKRYPGKRALPRDGRGLVEALLVADGIAPGDVYRVLETADGISRILKKMRALGSDVVWYDRVYEAIGLVRSDKATIAFTSNGHAFTGQARSGRLGLIWDGQVLHPSYFAISKSAGEPDQAMKLLALSSRPEKLAAIVREIPYGPMRRSALAVALGMRHAVTGQEIGPFLPTAPENMRSAVRFDPVWWEANGGRMEATLRIARKGPPVPIRP
jgi:putative spermidine/putrescine transport system substrate-binding protein